VKVTWLALEWPREGHHSGGVGRYVARLGERMRDLVDLTVVAYADAVPMPGVRMLTLDPPRSRMDRFYLSPARARRLVAGSEPDVLHGHGDDWLAPGSLPWMRSFYGSSWNEAMSSTGLRRANHMLLAGTEALSARRADLRLGIAPESVDRFRCQHVFPPFLPTQTVTARAPGSVPEVAFIGSHQGRKRGHLVEAAVAAMNVGRDEPVRLTVVGPLDDAGSWAPWVDHRSGLDDAEVSAILARAWCLAAPSEYEGFGIPTIEAIGHGVAVVATSNPGTDYLAGIISDADSPLVVTSADEFGDVLRQQVEAGPRLTAHAQDRALHLVRTVGELGSGERLLSLYESIAR
jgi:glycosyltransferase involved in cell wall biosynthesis